MVCMEITDPTCKSYQSTEPRSVRSAHEIWKIRYAHDLYEGAPLAERSGYENDAIRMLKEALSFAVENTMMPLISKVKRRKSALERRIREHQS